MIGRFGIIMAKPKRTVSEIIQATNIQFSNITRTSMTVSWTRGSGDGVILLARERYAVPNTPLVNGAIYTNNSGDYLDPLNSTPGSSVVVYKGEGTTINVTGLTRYMLVYFKLCEYIETDGEGPIYLQTESLGNPRSRWTLR